MKQIWLVLAAMIAALGFASPMAYAQDADDYDYADYYGARLDDPWEPFNRGVFKFNEVLDTVLLRPVAKGYVVVVPEYGRQRVTNVLTNLSEPVVMLNAVLQGDPERAFTSFWRFVLNSTFGVLGIFDFAGYNTELVYREEDFGQTLGKHGVRTGPYVVLPILGPSSGRDAVGRLVDILTNPFNYTRSETFLYTRIGMTAIDGRSQNLELLDQIYETSVDPYATIRSAYGQRREALIRNSQPREAKVGY